jgi:dipeptidyl aminopeptidase/acylaminoacyl peptidase
MSARRVAPFGAWPSPITASMPATAAVSLSEPAIDDGVAYWRESRPAEGGRNVIVRGDPFSEPADVTPPGFNVRTTVHEYGGGAYQVAHGVVFFSNFDDQRVYRQDPGAEPTAITADTAGRDRYADGQVSGDGRWWIGVRERHAEPDVPTEVVNELVALPTDGASDPRVLASRRDFYSNPCISPDGSQMAFLAWDLPWMPWDGCELLVARLSADADVSDVRHVAGRDGEESIWQPAWNPAGELHFASDRSGWWNLERVRGGERHPIRPVDAEFGFPHWVFGERSFGFLPDGRIVCWYERLGVQHLAVLDAETGELLDLDVPHSALARGPHLAIEGEQLVFIAGAADIPTQVVWLDFASRAVEVLRESADVPVDPAFLSRPRQVVFPTENGLTAFAHLYPPTNRDVEGPPGERPPLIVMSHGGPTSEATPVFDLEMQFWTSRGFAVVDVNYGGSTGFGRAYRQRLNGTWGITDVADCIAAASFLVDQGEVDGDRLLIRGGSAGGYTTLCALTFHDDFAAGASYYGISDLEPFATGDTHKFESRYEHTLVGPWPEAADVYRARSPIHFVDMISTPMLVLQGAEDKVVPPSQAEVMVEALRAKGLPHAYLLFEGEQHGFRRSETITAALEAELSFYRQILGLQAGDEIPPLEIENLTAASRRDPST